jgi:hypothetical protein
VSEDRPVYPRDPAPAECLTETYRLTRREFEIIAALRQMHFLEGLRPRTAVITRNEAGKPVVLDCVQVRS